MRIGIIGSGNVGGTLGTRWAERGHEVFFSTRNPDDQETKALLVRAGTRARAGSVAQVVEASEVLLLATPWAAAQAVLEACGDFGDRILIDATNPLNADLTALQVGTTTSAAEMIAAWARGARVVKGLNSVGFNIMASPAFPHGKPVMFYCGDDTSAKATVHGLIAELGFEAQDAGPLTQARLLEPFALLWISLAYKSGFGREIGFQFLRR